MNPRMKSHTEFRNQHLQQRISEQEKHGNVAKIKADSQNLQLGYLHSQYNFNCPWPTTKF